MTLPHDPSALRDREYREAYVEGHVKSYIPYQLRAIREKLRLTQKAFAERIGKPQSVVSRLENTEYGKVTVQTLLDIARGLDIALVVKFASFPEFLAAYADLSAETMAVEAFSEKESRAPSPGDYGFARPGDPASVSRSLAASGNWTAIHTQMIGIPVAQLPSSTERIPTSVPTVSVPNPSTQIHIGVT